MSPQQKSEETFHAPGLTRRRWKWAPIKTTGRFKYPETVECQITLKAIYFYDVNLLNPIRVPWPTSRAEKHAAREATLQEDAEFNCMTLGPGVD
ncbi:hypothetical protein PIIN_01366 [Serendipita indica DSM 11827]|uniref:Uncharacterized protein n=1 Tax=Serendipita indica (strain DSM 11827) TaxID=1109443 RepID=G4T876_SERID|nr:hypothetical protein PIIN_01366 [Serendipita indica DSM 11827]